MSAIHRKIKAIPARQRRWAAAGNTILVLAALLLLSGCEKEKFNQVAGDLTQAFSGAAEGLRGEVSEDESGEGEETASLEGEDVDPNDTRARTRSVFAAIRGNWTPGDDAPEQALEAHEQKVEIAGYTAAYRGVRAQTRTGAMELALDELDKLADPAPAPAEPEAAPVNVTYAEEEAPASVDHQGFRGQDKIHLGIERGTLLLEKGDLEAAVVAFEEAEQLLKKRGRRSYTGDATTEAKSFFGSVFSGDGEYGPYDLQPYEEILFLNYKAIGYLLDGRSEAYNVSRRAAERQNELRAKFVKLIEQAKADIKDEQEGQDDPEILRSLGPVQEWVDGIRDSYAEVGDRVPSAYVNPFGYYVVGMVNEIKSYGDPTLRHNARIAYEKALELNPDSPVIEKAVEAMTDGFARDDQKVVHLIGGIGMVPEKHVATYGFPLLGRSEVMPLKFPIYKTVPDVVHRIEVRDKTGLRKLGTLSALSDIEAMVLRYQKDRLPTESVKFFVGLYPRIVEKTLWSGLGAVGDTIESQRNEQINPDMRSWLALPARFQAARLVVPANLSMIQLRSYDADGRELGRQTVDLPPDTHGFAYIRAVDKVLTAQAGKASWL